MSEARIERTRRTLPEGYQFGDAGKNDTAVRFGRLFGYDTLRDDGMYAWLVSADDTRGPAIQTPRHWNVIEGEPV